MRLPLVARGEHKRMWMQGEGGGIWIRVLSGLREWGCYRDEARSSQDQAIVQYIQVYAR